MSVLGHYTPPELIAAEDRFTTLHDQIEHYWHEGKYRKALRLADEFLAARKAVKRAKREYPRAPYHGPTIYTSYRLADIAARMFEGAKWVSTGMRQETAGQWYTEHGLPAPEGTELQPLDREVITEIRKLYYGDPAATPPQGIIYHGGP